MPYSLTLTAGTLFEFLLACCIMLAAIKMDRLGRRLWIGAQIAAGRARLHPGLLIALAAALPIAIRLLLLPVDPVPQPYVMEEYSHLLQADTYSLGRLANPVHPLAVMLQSYQEIGWPHFMSARPPLMALFLSIGMALSGSAFIGNLIAIALTSAALCWMLLGWVTRKWAVIGSFLAISTFCLFGYWINSFWCPTVSVMGGALLIGVVPRVERNPRPRWAVIFVAGLALLAGTRPYENALYAGIICLWLMLRFLRPERHPQLRTALIQFALPASVGIIAIISAQLGYNAVTTGNVRLMPYQIWRASQDFTPMFLWQPIEGHPTFYSPGAELFARWNISLVTSITHGGLFGAVQLLGRQAVTFRDLLGPLLFLPLLCWSPTWLGARYRSGMSAAFVAIALLLFLAWGWAAAIIRTIVVVALLLRWRNEDERLPILLVLAGMIATSLPTFYMTVYFAAFTGPLLILVVQGLRHLSQWSRPVGPSLAGFLLLGCAVMPVAETAALAVNHPLDGGLQSHFDLKIPNPHRDIARILQRLPGRQVIFVRLAPGTNDWFDPVWNAADVDAQKIVWLRDLKPSWSATAQRYYHGRQFWLALVDEEGRSRIVPYPTASLPAPLPLQALPIPDRATAQRLGAHEP